MKWVEDDGGRAAAGFTGRTGDCVTRAIAIATGKPYREVYDALHEAVLGDRRKMAKLELHYGRHARRHASPREGVDKDVSKRYLLGLGWRWTPTMLIGQGCKVHLAEGELPPCPRMIVKVTRHLCAVVDGAIRDTHDPSRDGTRCVYGVWTPPEHAAPVWLGDGWAE